jgi:hypothetical protein
MNATAEQTVPLWFNRKTSPTRYGRATILNKAAALVRAHVQRAAAGLNFRNR